MTLDMAVWASVLAQQLVDTPMLFGYSDSRTFFVVLLDLPPLLKSFVHGDDGDRSVPI